MIRNPSDFEKSEPLYMLLAREIRDKILCGKLTPGERMPTVKEMCTESGLSAGTVRQAYGLLQTEGLIELTPGRGTFVSVPKTNDKSRKAQALEAIDNLLHDLASMGFSQAESRMLLTLRLAQKDLEAHLTPAAFVAESAEELRSVYELLSDIPDIEITAFSAEEIRNAGSVVLSEFPLVVCPVKLQSEIGGILTERADVMCPIAYTPSPETVRRLARLDENARILIYAQTETFAKLVKKSIRALLPDSHVTSMTFGKLSGESTLHSYDIIVTAPDCAAFAPEDETAEIRAFSESGRPVLSFELCVDEGSLIALTGRISRITRKTKYR